MGDLSHEKDTTEEGDQLFKVYVIINDRNYPVDSNKVLDAVEYRYKAFLALGIDFPPECCHVYTFLTTYIYKTE